MTNSRDLILTAMKNEEPERVPAFCQLAIGHTLLNTGVDPVEFNFTNEGFAEGLLKIREKYDFDAILLHKPGRDRSVLDRISEIRQEPDGPALIFPDGGKILCTRDDDPRFWPPEGWKFPGVLSAAIEDPVMAVEQIDPDNPLEGLPQSYLDWSLHKGLHYFMSPEAIPDFYFGAIDLVLKAVDGKFSVHGEVKAPSDYLLNLMGLETAMMAMVMNPDACHRIMETATRAVNNWAVAQVKRGCDAIKISSPYAGGGFLSREHYEEFIVPYEREVCRAVHEAGAFVYSHTCGAIGDRLDLMIQTELDGIETLDPPPLGDTDLKTAKAKFGDRIFFKGNMDSVNVLLRGDRETVRKATRDVLEIGAPGGGYILSTACSVAPAVPAENMFVMMETLREFNRERYGRED